MKRTLLFFFLLLSTIGYSQADLVITNTDFKDTYIPGTEDIYTITVINYGPQAATNVNITNAIPTGITYFSWQGSNGSSGENIALNNIIPTLAVGAMVTYVVTLEVPSAFTGNLTSTTTYTSASTDPNPGCTTCVDVNTRATGANIDIENTDNNLFYIPGAQSTYTVKVRNKGPLSANTINVQNAIPAGITNFSWSGNGATGTNVPLDDTIPLLLANESVVYTIIIDVPMGFTGDLTSISSFTTATPDPVPGCTGCVDINTEAIGADLEITNTNIKRNI